MTRQDSSPNLIERYAVLATLKTAARRLRRWPAASLDRRSARRSIVVQAGTEKRRSGRTEKLLAVELHTTKSGDSMQAAPILAGPFSRAHPSYGKVWRRPLPSSAKNQGN
jgi:hypothetical protein